MDSSVYPSRFTGHNIIWNWKYEYEVRGDESQKSL